MLEELGRTAYLILPLLAAAVTHGFFIKFDWLKSLKTPIDRGATLGGKPLFGANKTWRGLIVVATGATVMAAVQGYWLHRYPTVASWEYFNYGEIQPIVFGVLYGLSAMLAELPNSFVKRRLDIQPGQAGSGFWLTVFYVVDQVDLLIGVWVVLAFYMNFDWSLMWKPLSISFALIFFGHQLVTVIGYFLGMRDTWR